MFFFVYDPAATKDYTDELVGRVSCVYETCYREYLNNCALIQRDIFPGSCVPSLGSLVDASSARTDLRICHVEDIGPHYAETLRRWRSEFDRCRGSVRALGYDESFIRLWHYYLCYCEAGFDEGYLGDLQLIMAGPNWHDQVTVDELPVSYPPLTMPTTYSG